MPKGQDKPLCQQQWGKNEPQRYVKLRGHTCPLCTCPTCGKKF
jgi:hypothetical protein